MSRTFEIALSWELADGADLLALCGQPVECEVCIDPLDASRSILCTLGRRAGTLGMYVQRQSDGKVSHNPVAFIQIFLDEAGAAKCREAVQERKAELERAKAWAGQKFSYRMGGNGAFGTRVGGGR